MDLGKELSAVGREMLAPVRDIGDYIRAQRTAAQISLRALADKAGVSNPYLSQIERGLRRPSAAILAQIADGLSISAESLLVRAGILRAADLPEAREVTDAIRADPNLTERQKASLAEIYRAFLHESQSARQGAQHATDDHRTTPPESPDKSPDQAS